MSDVKLTFNPYGDNTEHMIDISLPITTDKAVQAGSLLASSILAFGMAYPTSPCIVKFSYEVSNTPSNETVEWYVATILDKHGKLIHQSPVMSKHEISSISKTLREIVPDGYDIVPSTYDPAVHERNGSPIEDLIDFILSN